MARPTRDRTLSIASMVTFSVLAGAVFAVLPMLVGATVEVLGFSAKQASLIAAADMLGACVSALAVASIISRGHWRFFLFGGLCCLTVANALSGLMLTFAWLFIWRVLAGLGEGALLVVTNASIGETHNPDRVFGSATAGQLAFGSPALYLMPLLLDALGLRVVFWALGAVTAATMLLVKFMPNRAVEGAHISNSLWLIGLTKQPYLALAGVFTYFIAQGAVWAYLDRIGVANHIEAERIGEALAISAIAGFIGASLATWLSVRQGRLAPLVASTLCSIVSLLILRTSSAYLVYAAAVSLFNLAWNFSIPYQFGSLAEVDPSRRTVALGGAVVFGGLTAGPVIAASSVGNGDFHKVTWVGIFFCTASLGLFTKLLIPIERSRLARIYSRSCAIFGR
jgi:MFS family permease